MEAEAETIRAEGWRWIEVHLEFAYGMAAGLRRVYPRAVELTEDEQARLDALDQDYEALSVQHGDEVATPEIEAEFDRLEAEIDALRGREAYDPEDVARAGTFVCLGHDGAARVERGFIRPEDEPAPEPVEGEDATSADPGTDVEPGPSEAVSEAEPEEPDGLTQLSERLVEELNGSSVACAAGRACHRVGRRFDFGSGEHVLRSALNHALRSTHAPYSGAAISEPQNQSCVCR